MIDDALSMCDILKKNGDGWDIYEVKSSTELKDEYYEDVTFQYHLLTKAGMKVSNIYLVYINNQYERDVELELDKLFIVEDVTAIAMEKVENVGDEIKRIQGVVESVTEPETDIDEYCIKPYECPCKAYCWRHIPEYSIFNLSGMWKSKQFGHYKNGIITYEDLLANKIKLNNSHQIQIDSHLNGSEVIVKDEIKSFLGMLSMPLYFLDFETFQQPVPLYCRLKPYEQIPFQYSLHYFDADGTTLLHKEFLGKEGIDPRRELAEKLVQDIPADACVVAYNMKFEKMIIKQLAERFCDLQAHLMKIHDNMKDIMIPFEKKHYYRREMKGSYSIKYVLPALYADNQDLKYEGLRIKNGEEAMVAFANLHLKDAEEIEQIRKDLREYCKLDTLAMVKVWEKLVKMVG